MTEFEIIRELWTFKIAICLSLILLASEMRVLAVSYFSPMVLMPIIDLSEASESTQKGHHALIRWYIITLLPALHSLRNSASLQTSNCKTFLFKNRHIQFMRNKSTLHGTFKTVMVCSKRQVWWSWWWNVDLYGSVCLIFRRKCHCQFNLNVCLPFFFFCYNNVLPSKPSALCWHLTHTRGDSLLGFACSLHVQPGRWWDGWWPLGLTSKRCNQNMQTWAQAPDTKRLTALL